MTEKSKLFKKMGKIVNYEITRKSQRCVVAKRMLPRLEKFEVAEFAKACPKIEFHQPIRIFNGKETYYL